LIDEVLVPPGDVDALAGALTELARSPERAGVGWVWSPKYGRSDSRQPHDRGLREAFFGDCAMTRVALLVTGLKRGGAELQVTALARELVSRGWEVAVFALRTGPLAADLPVEAADPSAEIPPAHSAQHLFHANSGGTADCICFLPIPVVISTVHSVAETGRHSTEIRYRDFPLPA
jgi:hypothetical protein